MICTILSEVCKRAGERRPWAFEWALDFANRWQPNQAYAAGQRVRPSALYRQTGFEYESDGGQSSGLVEPTWGRVVNLPNSRVDGSVNWTARELSYDSLLERIDSVTITVPSGISVHEQIPIDEPGRQQTPIEVSGGTVGEVYDIVLNISTTAGRIYEAVLRVTIE